MHNLIHACVQKQLINVQVTHVCRSLHVACVIYMCVCNICAKCYKCTCMRSMCVCVCLYASVCVCYMCCVYHPLMLSAQDGSNKTLGSQKSG